VAAMDEDEASEQGPVSADTALARFILDIRSRGLTEPALLTAFERLPRALFLPGQGAERLYAPIGLPLPCGEEATDAFTIGRHLSLLEIRPGQRVLEIGLGSGFQAALLARLGASVTSYERYRTLLRGAEQALRAAGITNVVPMLGDGLSRLDRSDMFDRVIVNGAVDSVPPSLIERLNPHGIVLAHRQRGFETRLTLWRKDLAGQAIEQDIGLSRMGPMRGGLPVVL
jgi:protein-L-isoaspartate(D-aspartate) O-methyltransferase